MLASVGAVIAFAYLPPSQPVGHPESTFHWHVKVEIFRYEFDAGASRTVTIPVEIPAGIGVESYLWNDHRFDEYGVGGMAPLHTHNASGLIHVEFNAVPPGRPPLAPFTLGDFFAIWGRPLSRTCVLDYCADLENGRPPPVMSVGTPGGKEERCVEANLPLLNTESQGGSFEITILLGAAPPEAVECLQPSS